MGMWTKTKGTREASPQDTETGGSTEYMENSVRPGPSTQALRHSPKASVALALKFALHPCLFSKKLSSLLLRISWGWGRGSLLEGQGPCNLQQGLSVVIPILLRGPSAATASAPGPRAHM
jgi:hypothetical protein